MSKIKAFAAYDAASPLKSFELERRAVGPHDVAIDIKYCGVCHSDIHQARNEWTGSIYPMVPGHEIVGIVSAVGDQVKKFKVGDKVGVGCFVDSCNDCTSCHSDNEHYCEHSPTVTYNGYERDGKTPTYGGYAQKIVTKENFVLSIPDSLPLDETAPLLCAGITTYSPLRHWGAGPGKSVAVVGLGGLGHMAVKLANAMGADVSVISHSPKKKEDALRLGAKHFYTDLSALTNKFDIIICTVSVPFDVNAYLNCLKLDGTMVMLGIPPAELPLAPANLIFKRRRLSGSLVGGIKETQEMLDFCAKHNITSDIEKIKIQDINNAYERILKGDVKYRFVIDNASLA